MTAPTRSHTNAIVLFYKGKLEYIHMVFMLHNYFGLLHSNSRMTKKKTLFMYASIATLLQTIMN